MRWLPSIIMVAYTLKLTYEKNFIPDNPAILWVYLLLLGLIVVPKAVFMLCSIVGLGFCKLFRSRRSFIRYQSTRKMECIFWICFFIYV